MHHRGRSAEHDCPAVTCTCPLIYVTQSSQKGFLLLGQTSESFVLVLKLNLIVTLSGCYCTSSKSHFLHHRHFGIVCWPHTQEGDGGGRRDRYMWTKPRQRHTYLWPTSLQLIWTLQAWPLRFRLVYLKVSSLFFRISEMSILNLVWKSKWFCSPSSHSRDPTQESVHTQSHYYSFHSEALYWIFGFIVFSWWGEI